MEGFCISDLLPPAIVCQRQRGNGRGPRAHDGGPVCPSGPAFDMSPRAVRFLDRSGNTGFKGVWNEEFSIFVTSISITRQIDQDCSLLFSEGGGRGEKVSCQVIYSQFGLAIHQNDHQARRRFVEWTQNEIAVVPDFHKRILFSDEAPFWLNDYVNKQNCRIWNEANPQVYVETPLHPEKLTVWCALWAGGILLQKR
ncbi:uncharacterized protein TNCV_1799681 [Trichonephila clavipes]|nr:uncharacterized protein TNCV_1799681 [Trichonephila clavipes]